MCAEHISLSSLNYFSRLRIGKITQPLFKRKLISHCQSVLAEKMYLFGFILLSSLFRFISHHLFALLKSNSNLLFPLIALSEMLNASNIILIPGLKNPRHWQDE